jgi:hypothetical protein
VPRTFITYRHENNAHKANVRSLALRLEAAGIQVILDDLADERQFNRGGPNEGWGAWSATQAKTAERTLIIGSPGWFQRFETPEPNAPQGKGVATEANVIRTQLENLQWVTGQHRIVYFEAADVAHVPLELQRYHRFQDDRDFADLVTWLGGTLPPPASGPYGPVANPSPWKPEDTAFDSGMANRDGEWVWYRQMIAGKTPERILLLEGESGFGKTTLFKALLEYAEQQLGRSHVALGDCKGGVELSRVLRMLADGLDASRLLPRYERSGARDPLDFASDLAAVNEPVALLFDTYEQANESVKKWIEEDVFPRVRRNDWLCVVIGGRAVPARTGATLHGLVRHFELGPIHDLSCWRRWCDRLNHSLTDDHLRLLIQAAAGDPATLARLLENCRPPRP